MNYYEQPNPYARPTGDKPPLPKNYLVCSILSTVLCCLPLGIVAIVYSTKVNDYYIMGLYDEAMRASAKSETMVHLCSTIELYSVCYLHHSRAHAQCIELNA